MLDTVTYDDGSGWPSTPDGGGPSLELKDVTSDNAESSNWQASTVDNGTPGAANSEAAYTYIDNALSAEAQTCFANKMYAGPVNTTVTLDGAAAEAVPPEMFETLYFPDPAVIAENVADWRRRWQREVTR